MYLSLNLTNNYNIKKTSKYYLQSVNTQKLSWPNNSPTFIRLILFQMLLSPHWYREALLFLTTSEMFVILWMLEVSAGFTSLSCPCLSGMPRFASQPSPATVHLGNNQVMACEVNSDLVPFTRWEKDRQPLELSTRLVQLPSGALVISNASEADAGLYRCLVENVGSSKSSDEAQLQILPGNLRKVLSDNGWQ